MRIVKLILKNWRQYRDATFDFTANTIGILGPNGVGKSNLIEAVRFAFTGDAFRTKARNLTWGEEAGSVTLEFVDSSGNHCVVSRDLVKSSCSIRVGDQPVVRKSADVNQILESLRGVSPAIFNSHVVVRQGDADSIIKARPADRAKEFGVLCGLDHCEAVHNAIGHHVNSYPQIQFDVKVEDLIAQLNTLSAEMVQLENNIRVLEETYARLSSQNADQVVIAYKAMKLREENSARVKARLIELDELLRKYASEITASAQHDKSEYLKQHAETFSQIKMLLSQVADIRKRKAMLEAANLAKQSAEAELNALRASPVVKLEMNLIQDAEDERLLHEAIKTAGTASSFLNTFSSGKTVCPTCFQTLTGDVTNMVREFKLQHEKATIAITEIQRRRAERMRSVQESQAAFHRWESQCSIALGKVERQQAVIDSFSNQSTETVNEAQEREYANFINSYSVIQTTQKEYEAWKAERLRVYERFQTERETLLANLAGGEQGRVVSEEEYSIALQIQKAMTENRSAHTESTVMIRTKNQQIQDLRIRYERITAQLEINQRISNVRTFLDTVRNIMHRDNLPRVLVHRRLQKLNRTLSDTLSSLNFPFSVNITEELKFECRSAEGHILYPDEFSGGQSMLFSFAFRLAVNQQFAANLGFLILDEPTAYVDDDNIAIVIDVLSRIRHYMRESGMQLIVVTHQPELGRVMEQVINVSDASHTSAAA